MTLGEVMRIWGTGVVVVVGGEEDSIVVFGKGGGLPSRGGGGEVYVGSNSFGVDIG